ncbi:hypothetical protein [Mucilaginibacter auburnensis]|nr:hypothetical protein [Mucilaginibacter auburnensis]
MIIDETRKIALIIAKLMGIKEQGTKQEFADEFEKVLKEEYEAELEALINLNEDEFKSLVNSGRYNAEKLNALSQLLYVFAEPFYNDADTKLLLKKVMIIFDVLEQKHRFQSFDNISKRNAIYRYFENNHE